MNRPATRLVIVGAAAALVVGAALAATADSTIGSTIGSTRAVTAAAPTSLRAGAAARRIFVGAAVDPGLFREKAYAATLAAQFNGVTPENVMKWDATEPTRGRFTFAQGDQVTAFAARHRQKVRAHALVWHQALPGWVRTLDATALRAALLNHVRTVASHFKGKVYSWDVVNEPFDDGGGWRSTPFEDKLGPGYIADAFRAARAADPTAKLYLNDYSVEGINAKSDALYRYVKALRAARVPIDGVGLQAHLTLGGVPDTMQRNIQRFAALGVDVAVTELDVRIPTPAKAADLQQQAKDYRAVLAACLAVKRCVSVTTWGFTDKYSWVPGFFGGQGAALPFDAAYRAKPAVGAMLAELGGSAR